MHVQIHAPPSHLRADEIYMREHELEKMASYSLHTNTKTLSGQQDLIE